MIVALPGLFSYLFFIKIKTRSIQVVILIKLIYFGGNDCLSLELKDYKHSVAKLFLKKPL